MAERHSIVTPSAVLAKKIIRLGSARKSDFYLGEHPKTKPDVVMTAGALTRND